MAKLGTIEIACDDAADHLSQALHGMGFEVVRSFDLQTARRGLRDPDGCSCPNHGMSQCDCQYVVLLVSNRGGEPATVVAHGHDNRTLLSYHPHVDNVHAREIENAVRSAFASLVTVE